MLEPLQAAPVIIEDGAFIGSRCIVVEGVKVEKEAVLGANVVLTGSTKIIDVTGETPIEYKGGSSSISSHTRKLYQKICSWRLSSSLCIDYWKKKNLLQI